ncbi:hypothetical protein SAMN05660903_01396 [Salegentibacter salinarum]|nr:hypothetical protein SAMN05660903_01396 [Salegentibacter salinarum]
MPCCLKIYITDTDYKIANVIVIAINLLHSPRVDEVINLFNKKAISSSLSEQLNSLASTSYLVKYHLKFQVIADGVY